MVKTSPSMQAVWVPGWEIETPHVSWSRNQNIKKIGNTVTNSVKAF